MNDKQKDRLLDALLPVVPFEGWSDTTLSEICTQCGMTSQEVAILFPRGMTDILRYFNQRLDTQMMAKLEGLGLDKMKVRERITLAVRTRLELMEPHREAVRKGLSFFAMPLKASEGMHNLYDTVDAMWLAAGDKSTDYNFYSKRLLLSGVYSSTMLFWLEDGSEGYEKTWAFLDRRISEVLKIGGALGKTIGRASGIAEKLRSLAPFSNGSGRHC